MIYGIIVAAGKSKRMGPQVDKAFLTLGTRPVLAYSLMAYEKCHEIDGVILVVRKDRVDAARSMAQLFGCSKVKKVVPGGMLRQDSVLNGLAELSEEVRYVSVHDGARPCVTPAIISETARMARRCDSGVAAVAITDTVKEVRKGTVVSRTLDRSRLWAVQTPQAFRRDLLEEALGLVRKKRVTVTDEASAVELLGKDVHLVPSTWTNIKITTADDLPVAACLLRL